METFRVPLTFSQIGGFALKLTEETREYCDQVINCVITTEPGSLQLDPSFGTADPTFGSGEPKGLRSTIVAYWPEIIVSQVTTSDADASGEISIFVDYEIR